MGKFLNFLNEMPHVTFQDKHFDFKFEKGDSWVERLVDAINSTEEPDFLRSLLNNEFFMMQFRKQVKILSKEKLSKLEKILPKEFFNHGEKASP